MERVDLRLAGGRPFLHGTGLTRADLLVHNGTIAGIIDPESPAVAESVVDLNGAAVLPGAIDPHVHLGKDIRVPKDSDDALLESASAAAGGVTSMLIYLMSGDPYDSVFEQAQSVMEGNSHVDYGFHFCLGTSQHVTDVPEYITELGVSSFKFFMNFRGEEGSYLGLPGNDDGYMYDLLGTAADNGAMVNPHPENIEIVWRLKRNKPDESLSPLQAWYSSRPPFVEAEAAQRVAYFASVTGASVYAVHTSSQAALNAIRLQQSAYPNLFVETCAHYLTLTTESSCGTFGKVNPPLRTQADLEALWAGVAQGSIDTVGSDHNARHRSFKEKDIWAASAGFPGVGAMFPLTLGEGLKRGVGLETLVDATSTRAAKLFGLYPRKGSIRIGSDADLVVVDLDGSTTISASTQYSAAEYTPWEGQQAPVRIVHTLLGGCFAVRDGEVSTEPAGRYLRRSRSGASALVDAEKAGAE